MKATALLCLVALSLSHAFSQDAAKATVISDFSTLYEKAVIDRWQSSFRDDITAMFREDILPILTIEEKTLLAEVRLEFPAVGERKGVFEFYRNGKTVLMPVLSLRFFGDLALAYSWLFENGYNTVTVQQYVGMIHWQPMAAFPKGSYPQPLEALQIPANVRDNPRVAARMGELFKAGIFFLLAHELGHIRYGHAGYENREGRDVRADEAQADAFAMDLMRRKRVLPAGPLFWLGSEALSERHKVDCATAEEWNQYFRSRTHPLSAARVEVLTERFAKNAEEFAKAQPDPVSGLAQMKKWIQSFREIASGLGDEGVHAAFREQSKTIKPSALAPRLAAFFEGEDFSGNFACKLIGPAGKAEMQLKFQRLSQKVIAEHTQGNVTMQVMGSLVGKKLSLDWWEGQHSGKAVLTADDQGAFTGTWGLGESATSLGTWDGKRIR